MIELFYQKFIAGDNTYRKIPLPGGYEIDFQNMTLINTNNPIDDPKVMRSTTF